MAICTILAGATVGCTPRIVAETQDKTSVDLAPPFNTGDPSESKPLNDVVSRVTGWGTTVRG